MGVDAVGTMKVDEETTEFTSEYDGVTYVFCSNACKEEFESDPERYIAAAKAELLNFRSPRSSLSRYRHARGTGLPCVKIHRSECIEDELTPDIATEIDG